MLGTFTRLLLTEVVIANGIRAFSIIWPHSLLSAIGIAAETVLLSIVIIDGRI